MSCEQYREIISAAMDGEADEEELAALRAHLEECPECRSYQEALSELSELLAADLPEPDESLTRSVMDAVREAERSKKVIRLHTRRRYATLAASLLVVAGLGYAALSGRSASADAEVPMTMMAQAAPEAAMAEDSVRNEESAADSAYFESNDLPAENAESRTGKTEEKSAPMLALAAPPAEAYMEEEAPEEPAAPMLAMAAPAAEAYPEEPSEEPAAPMLTMAAPAAGSSEADEGGYAYANGLPDYLSIVRDYLSENLPEAAADLEQCEPEIFFPEDGEITDCEFCTEGYVPFGSVCAVRFTAPSVRCILTVYVDETGTVFATRRE